VGLVEESESHPEEKNRIRKKENRKQKQKIAGGRKKSQTEENGSAEETIGFHSATRAGSA
jgi:hypothetical protein